MKNSLVIFVFIFLSFVSQAQNTLYLGVGSNISKSVESQKTINELAQYLSEKLGLTVSINSLKAGKTLEQIQEGKLDVALMNTFGYVLASSEGNMEALVVVGNTQKEPISYQSCLIAHPSTQIKTLEDLKQEASKYFLGFVSASSTSGHLVPRLFLNRLDLQPEMSFKDVQFIGSHQEVIQKISSGELKIGAVSYTDLEELIKAGKYSKTDFNILWTSEPITNGPVSVRKDLSVTLKTKLQEVWINLPKNNPALHTKVVKLWHNTNSQSIFIPAQNSLYDNIRKMANSMEEISVLVGLYSE
ncbi:MAG: phosphate/phosphite/phosphonate ABC transporter substrate-binding protein [Raineya sp.]|jgi:phosphonate transport system substrate-binding protein|nr:phosphate/phosphite/phosphonate ABC transporter substrate-binding protein [Raineya sp.]